MKAGGRLLLRWEKASCLAAVGQITMTKWKAGPRQLPLNKKGFTPKSVILDSPEQSQHWCWNNVDGHDICFHDRSHRQRAQVSLESTQASKVKEGLCMLLWCFLWSNQITLPPIPQTIPTSLTGITQSCQGNTLCLHSRIFAVPFFHNSTILYFQYPCVYCAACICNW